MSACEFGCEFSCTVPPVPPCPATLHTASARLPAAPGARCSNPVVIADAVSAVEGKAVVTPPMVNRPWARYELTVCVKDASPATCRVLPPCAASADANAATQCAIPGCDAGITYTVVAVAIQAGGLRSPASAAAEFSTPAHRSGPPAPALRPPPAVSRCQACTNACSS